MDGSLRRAQTDAGVDCLFEPILYLTLLRDSVMMLKYRRAKIINEIECEEYLSIVAVLLLSLSLPVGNGNMRYNDWRGGITQ